MADTAKPFKDPLLQSLTLRGLTLKNRIMSTAHTLAMDDANMPVLRYQRYHEEKAMGELALTRFGGPDGHQNYVGRGKHAGDALPVGPLP